MGSNRCVPRMRSTGPDFHEGILTQYATAAGRIMTIVFVLLALAAVALIAVLAAGRIGQLNDPIVDRYRADPPNAPLSSEDVSQLRFGTAFRGYRMDEVDDILGRLSESLRIREAQLAAATGHDLDTTPHEGHGSRVESDDAAQS